ncbi:TPA: hypothetical protein ACIVOO_004845 [Salmonella enterica subsp. enterica serovar Weltevreden]
MPVPEDWFKICGVY